MPEFMTDNLVVAVTEVGLDSQGKGLMKEVCQGLFSKFIR